MSAQVRRKVIGIARYISRTHAVRFRYAWSRPGPTADSLARLVGDDEQRLSLPLHLVRDRLEPRDQVDVRLAARVPVGELVGLARSGLVRRVSRASAE